MKSVVEFNNDKSLILLGAGASYGHREKPGPDTPPLMKDFLVEAVNNGILNYKDFPQLASIINGLGRNSSAPRVWG